MFDKCIPNEPNFQKEIFISSITLFPRNWIRNNNGEKDHFYVDIQIKHLIKPTAQELSLSLSVSLSLSLSLSLPVF